MAETRKLYNERAYYADQQGDTANIPADFKGLGYYRRTSLTRTTASIKSAKSVNISVNARASDAANTSVTIITIN